MNGQENQAEQFNWALENLSFSTKWVLRLDADEYLQPELVKELNEKLPSLPEEVSGIIFKPPTHIYGQMDENGGILSCKVVAGIPIRKGNV